MRKKLLEMKSGNKKDEQKLMKIEIWRKSNNVLTEIWEEAKELAWNQCIFDGKEKTYIRNNENAIKQKKKCIQFFWWMKKKANKMISNQGNQS